MKIKEFIRTFFWNFRVLRLKFYSMVASLTLWKIIHKYFLFLINFLKTFFSNFSKVINNGLKSTGNFLMKVPGLNSVLIFIAKIFRKFGLGLKSKFKKSEYSLVKNKKKGYVYLLPAIVFLTIFTFYPIVNTFIMSLKVDYKALADSFKEISLKEYGAVFSDKYFIKAILNTLLIAFVTVPVSIILSLAISIGLTSIKKFQGLYQTIFFLPYLTNTIALGLVFAFIFNADFGLFNKFLGIFGVSAVNWIGPGASYATAMFVVLIYTIWGGMAFKILIFVSGLQNIDKQYYQAAKIDSASKWRTFRKVTVPLLSPMIFYVSVTSLIAAFKSYTIVVSLFGEDMKPAGSGKYMMITIVGYILKSFDEIAVVGAMSRASAGAVVLFIIIIIFTYIQMKISKRYVHY